MTPEDYAFICRLVREQSAIALDEGKRYLVESRLAPILREHKLACIGELVRALRTGGDNGLRVRVIQAMVTTETSFFRDVTPFEALRTVVLPELVKRRAAEQSLRIWCAACSTGQEPYSVALLLREHFPHLAAWTVSILATDLSAEVLAKARAGRYSQLEVNRGLPAALLVKYFRQQGAAWELADEIRSMVQFRELNLATPWSALPMVDLVLLRNVMIYFEPATKSEILGRVARLLRPGGYLLLGGAETTRNLCDAFTRVEVRKVGFYQLDPTVRV
jgi:chemotaxis protein methyltransferase CheR